MNPGASGGTGDLTSLLEASGGGQKQPRPPTGQKEKDSSRRASPLGLVPRCLILLFQFAWGPDPSAAKGVMVSDIDYPRP